MLQLRELSQLRGQRPIQPICVGPHVTHFTGDTGHAIPAHGAWVADEPPLLAAPTAALGGLI